MAKKQIGVSPEITKVSAVFRERVQDLLKLADQMTYIGNRITKITEKLDQDLHLIEERAGDGITIPPFEYKKSGFGATQGTCRIIPFNLPDHSGANSPGGDSRALTPFLAAPGQPLPSQLPDFRPDLQRDGLILLAWDRRSTEMGERFTAYWVTSTGPPRFYASRPLSSSELSTARPHHKSYAAEDGIEFYGEEAPHYMVHVAPELMKSNPRHGELRQQHIKMLKKQGSKVDFSHRYLLKNDKSRKLRSMNKADGGDERAWA